MWAPTSATTGTSDILAFHRHDSNLTNLNMRRGQSNLYTSEPTLPWQGSGWGGDRMIPAGIGNISGNRYQDAAAFYNHDHGSVHDRAGPSLNNVRYFNWCEKYNSVDHNVVIFF